jgi:aarF domain-containing kinase
VPKQPALQFRGFASRPGAEERDYESYEKKRKRRRLLLASTAGAAGVASFFLADEVKHAYGAAERSGRVLSTLAVCVNE